MGCPVVTVDQGGAASHRISRVELESRGVKVAPMSGTGTAGTILQDRGVMATNTFQIPRVDMEVMIARVIAVVLGSA